MSKAVDVAKTSTTAGFHYLWGLVISTVISSVGTIFIANLLGSDLYGLYAIALSVPNLLTIFRDWGINSAMIRYTAQYRVEGRKSEVRSIFMAGIVFELILGIALSLVSFLFSGFIANSVYNQPIVAPLIQIASISILAGGIINVASAAFTGTEVTTYNSVMLVCQSVIKTFVIIGLVYAGLGTSGAVVGYTVASIVAWLIGIIFTLSLYRKFPKPFSLKLETLEYTKEMLKYSIPLSLAAIVSGFMAQFYVVILPWFVDNSVIGNYGLSNNFVVLISFFSLPITTMLFPAFSKLDVKKDSETLRNIFQYSVKYASLLVVPVAALVMCLSGPAVATLFGDKYSLAPLFLALSAIGYLFTAAGNLSTGNILASQGQTNLSLKITLLTVVIGFPLGYLLIMLFGVAGLIISSAVAGIPGLLFSLVWVKRNYGLTVDWLSSTKILASSAIAAVLTYLFVGVISFSSLVELLLGVLVYAVVLIGAILFTRALSLTDLKSLRDMTGGLGSLSKIFNAVLDILEKVMVKLKLANY
jgi:O-antigen/teichoic acid export membrane protein